MWTYILRRLLQAIPTLLIISLLIFSLLYVTPGDPVDLILGTEDGTVSEEQRAVVEEQWGLDKPFLVRYVNFVVNACKGDLGTSYATNQDVFDSVMTRMPATLKLAAFSMLLALVVSVPLGILAALKHNSIWDSLATALATVGVSLPKFWFGLVLMIVFSLRLGWLPSTGSAELSEGLGTFLSYIIMPAASLALGMAATQTRMIRSSMLDVLNQDYVRYARSKGLRERVVIWGHALKNAMIPVITVIGGEVGGLLGGAVVTESIFSWPGVGRLMMNSISKRDYPMIQGITLMLCISYLLVNLLIDIVYAWVDPRIRLDKKSSGGPVMRDKKKKVDPVQKGASGEIGLESLPVTTYWTDVVRRFRKNKIAVVGLVMLLIIVILCAGAPLFTKYDPILDMDLLNQLKPPGSEGHILGTDNLGRDIWSRLLYGGRTSVLTGLTVALITGAIGVAIGLISGYFGGIVETILMRMTDIMLSFPFLIIAIAIMAALGSSQRNIILALAIVGWPRFARLTRGQVLAVKNSEYVESAKVAGFGNARIILNHILPNCMGPIIIQATLAVGGAILSASSLTYLGLGADAAAPDWGVMLSQGRQYLQSEAYLTIIPGLAISVTVLAMNWIGDGLRDAFDPKMRK